MPGCKCEINIASTFSRNISIPATNNNNAKSELYNWSWGESPDIRDFFLSLFKLKMDSKEDKICCPVDEECWSASSIIKHMFAVSYGVKNVT